MSRAAASAWRLVLVVAAFGTVLVGCKSKKSSSDQAPTVRDDAAVVDRAPPIVIVKSVAVRTLDTELTLPGDEVFANGLTAIVEAHPATLSPRQAVPEGRRTVDGQLIVTLACEVVSASDKYSLICAAEGTLELRRTQALEADERVLIERPLDTPTPKDLDALVAQAAIAAVKRAGQAIVAREGLRQGPDEDILAALDDEDPDHVAWALRLVAERKLGSGFDKAAAAFESEDAVVADAAVRALVAIGDPRAIDLLAKGADFSDADKLIPLIEAVTVIGGEEAIEFLELVASGHDDPELRTMAEDSIERVRSRLKNDHSP